MGLKMLQVTPHAEHLKGDLKHWKLLANVCRPGVMIRELCCLLRFMKFQVTPSHWTEQGSPLMELLANLVLWSRSCVDGVKDVSSHPSCWTNEGWPETPWTIAQYLWANPMLWWGSCVDGVCNVQSHPSCWTEGWLQTLELLANLVSWSGSYMDGVQDVQHEGWLETGQYLWANPLLWWGSCIRVWDAVWCLAIPSSMRQWPPQHMVADD